MENSVPPPRNSLHDCCIFDKHVEASSFPALLFDINNTVLRLFSHLFLRYVSMYRKLNHQLSVTKTPCPTGVVAVQRPQLCSALQHV